MNVNSSTTGSSRSKPAKGAGYRSATHPAPPGAKTPSPWGEGRGEGQPPHSSTGTTGAPPSAAQRSPLAIAIALLRSTRPQQWVKNVLVFAGVIFSQQLTDRDAVLASVLTFGLFVLASGGIYLVNDILDVEADRAHPLKRKRPLAAGALPLPAALCAAVVLLGGALAGAFLLQVVLGAILALYVAMNLAYSAWLKHVALLDAALIALGFVLRAAAGTAAVLTPISPWLYICTLLLSLLIILGKRRGELALLGTGAAAHRRNLARYTTASLDRWLRLVAATTAVAYVLYTLFAPATFGDPRLIVTTPFVAFGLLRYLRAARNPGGSDAPETLLFRDPWLLASVALWGIAVLALLYLARGAVPA